MSGVNNSFFFLKMNMYTLRLTLWNKSWQQVGGWKEWLFPLNFIWPAVFCINTKHLTARIRANSIIGFCWCFLTKISRSSQKSLVNEMLTLKHTIPEAIISEDEEVCSEHIINFLTMIVITTCTFLHIKNVMVLWREEIWITWGKRSAETQLTYIVRSQI